jgi:hypothetical protein
LGSRPETADDFSGLSAMYINCTLALADSLRAHLRATGGT